MDADLNALIRQSACESNILPVTSRCDGGCVFCSHRNNPPGVRVFGVGTRTLDEITETMRYLRADREITIGDSATRINEGEPLMHPDFPEIMIRLRDRFPSAGIMVTTNGRRLDDKLAAALAKLGGITVNLSLNSATVEGRRILMGEDRETAERTLTNVSRLRESGLTFHGSLVAMPNLTGLDDAETTVRALAAYGAMSVRVFIPGCSGYVREGLFPDWDETAASLRELTARLSDELPVPILLEPSIAADLRAEISGVLPGSPAYGLLRRGDVITAINGISPRSRVEAFAMLEPPGDYTLSVSQGGTPPVTVSLSWSETGGSGITMEYDFDMERAESVRRAVLTAPGLPIALTSELGFDAFAAMVQSMGLTGKLAVHAVRNRTFGGSIRCSGLLCADDYIAAFTEYFTAANPALGAVMLPSESFSSAGYDLTGRHVSELGTAFKLPTALL